MNKQRCPPTRRPMRSDSSLDREQRRGISSQSHSGASLAHRTTNRGAAKPASISVSKAPPALPNRRQFRTQFSTSTLLKRKEDSDEPFAAALPAQPCMMSLEKLASLSGSMKSLDSLNFNLQNQAKKLEQNIQSLANLQSNVPLFPTKRPVEPSSADLEPSSKLPPLHRSLHTPRQPPKSEMLSSATSHPKLKSPTPAKMGKTKAIQERATMEFPILELTIPAGGMDAKKKSSTGKKKPKEPKQQTIEKEGLVKSSHSSGDKEAHSKLVAAKSQATLATQESLTSDSKNQPSVGYTASCCSTVSGRDSRQSNITALERFVTKERPRREQIDALTERQRECLALMRQHWEADHQSISRPMYLRFARFCRFDLRKGQRILSRFDERYLSLTATQLEAQLLTQTLFPLPGLKSIKGHDMFYARPSRHNPQTTETQIIIDNLAYVMLTMIEREDAATNGIGILAYMNDCSMANFTVESCLNFMKMLQGGVPARIRLVLIVNPPTWFGKLWKVMKPMLHPTFQRKIQIIPERSLSAYLAPGYSSCLPTDMMEGTVDTNHLVKDFITYRKHVETKKSWLTTL